MEPDIIHFFVTVAWTFAFLYVVTDAIHFWGEAFPDWEDYL